MNSSSLDHFSIINNDRPPAHLKIWKVADGKKGMYFAWPNKYKETLEF